jgi:hypothetical protein
MINLTSPENLILSLVSKALGDEEFIFFIPNEGGVMFDFVSKDKKYKFTISLKDYDFYSENSGNLRIYDNGNIYFIKNIFSNGIADLKTYFVFEIEGVSKILKDFYEFEYEKVSNGSLYKFTKKII